MAEPFDNEDFLSGDDDYVCESQITKALLEWIEGALFDRAINLGCAGPLREWNETVPEGTVMTFDVEGLRTCGDARVAALLEVKDAVVAALLLFDESSS